MTTNERDAAAAGGGIKSPREVAAGVFLLVFAALGFAGAYGLDFGKLSAIGPGLLPKVLAVMVGAFGVLLVVQGLTIAGEQLETWAIRGPLFILAAVVAFALAVRPLGLLVAGPLAIVISALADRDTKVVEISVFALLLTMMCGFMFKDLLALPIPFDPIGIIPEPVVGLWVGVKKWFVAIVLNTFKR